MLSVYFTQFFVTLIHLLFAVPNNNNFHHFPHLFNRILGFIIINETIIP